MCVRLNESQGPDGNRPPKALLLGGGRQSEPSGLDARVKAYVERPQQSNLDPWLDVRGVAEYADISVGHACTQMTTGRMKSIKRGRMRRARVSWVDAWLHQREVA